MKKKRANFNIQPQEVFAPNCDSCYLGYVLYASGKSNNQKTVQNVVINVFVVVLESKLDANVFMEKKRAVLPPNYNLNRHRNHPQAPPIAIKREQIIRLRTTVDWLNERVGPEVISDDEIEAVEVVINQDDEMIHVPEPLLAENSAKNNNQVVALAPLQTENGSNHNNLLVAQTNQSTASNHFIDHDFSGNHIFINMVTTININ